MDEPVLWSQAVAGRTVPVSRYHREWVEPRGLIDAAAIGIVRDATMIGNVAFGRHGSAGPIRSGEIDGLRLLAPHLRRAVVIGNLFEMKAIEAATLGSALDALASPMVLVDDSLGIIHANAAARQMLAARTPIRSDSGALTLPAAVSHGALARAVRDAAGDAIALGAKGIGIPAPGPDDNPYVVHVLPLKPGEMRRGIAPRVAAALFVTSAGATPRLPADALALLFDLTPAETRVFELIVAGKTRSEIADTLGIAQSTLKTHLLRLFDKTGSSRQADLVRLATRLSLPA